jgi:cell division protein FtsZ
LKASSSSSRTPTARRCPVRRRALKLQLGTQVTQGLGAGAKPQVGAAAAEESIEAIVDHLAGSHMCFITAGMGGGTGTGAAPIIAKTAREMGILTVGVVTKPFQFEGTKRMRIAEEGIEELQAVVDTLIIIPNQNLFRIANERTTFTEAFMMADDVLYQGVKGVTDLMVRPGIINLDFADVRSVMDEMGKAMMGTGEASGDDRAVEAAEKAIANPLLDEVSLKGARGVLINVTGGDDLTLFELDEAANRIRTEVDPDANIIVGSTLDPEMNGMMRVSVVATGIDTVRSDAMPMPRKAAGEAVAQHHQQAPATPPPPPPSRCARSPRRRRPRRPPSGRSRRRSARRCSPSPRRRRPCPSRRRPRATASPPVACPGAATPRPTRSPASRGRWATCRRASRWPGRPVCRSPGTASPRCARASGRAGSPSTASSTG